MSELKGSLLNRTELEQPPVTMIVEISPDDPNYNLVAGYRSKDDPGVVGFEEVLDGSSGAIVDASQW